MDVVRKLILDKLAEKRLSMKDASLSIGKNHSYLQQFLKRGVPAQLDEEIRAPLADLLGVNEEQLRGPSSKLPKREYVKGHSTERENLIAAREQLTPVSHNDKNPPQIAAAHLLGEEDLPVFGTAQGGSGALIVSDKPVDWVVRPAPLLRVLDGYGMIVTGDSMSPMHRNGSIALVNPHIPPKNEDVCIFRSHAEDGTVHIIIKELRRFTDTTWYVRQYNPPKDYTLKRSEWQICHVTVGSFFGR